jgi:RNA 2',3'-cyclic 3'-phosphodiesterase
MTLPPVVRVFFAIDLPQSIKEQLGSVVGALKKKAKSNSIRWTKQENLHITLQFLPEVRSEHLPALIANVRAKMEGAMHHAELTFGELHLFPNPYRPRVIVVEIIPQDDLAALAELIGHGIKASHCEIESRPFRAHLTLGRIKQPQGINLGFLAEFKSLAIEKVTVLEVVLFRSEPQPEGSQYTVIERIALTKKVVGV